MKLDKLKRIIKEGLHDMSIIWANEMKMTVKDEAVLIFFLLASTIYPFLYSWIYNNEVVREVPVAVVDYSHSSESRKFIRLCNASPDVKVAYHCTSLAEAKDLVGRQKAKGVLYFPSDFDTNICRGEQAHVSVFCDMSLMLTYKAIYQTAQAVSSQMGSEIQLASSTGFTDRDDEVTVRPLEFDEVSIFNPTGGYGSFLLPAVLILVIQQTLLLGIGLAAGTNRENNRYGELIPIDQHYRGLFRIVMGKALCYFMIYALVAAYLTMILPSLFHFPLLGSLRSLIGLMVPYILACIFFGITLSCLVRYRENVMLLVVVTSLPFLFLSGISWPSEGIPAFWKGISWLLPSTFGVKGYIAVNSMGATLQDISHEYFVLWAQSLIYFFTSCLFYKVQIDRAIKQEKEDLDTSEVCQNTI
ncbi:MAG: ABC transporter permease [Bacteroidales bacterium]|nr:ABC transporter permease [Bacteroidales bacterium]MBR3540732.1 ABC transporter permease [Bacteroidales bacterium]